MIRDFSWTGKALCRQYDPEIWFPVRGRYSWTAKAKRVCKNCPVLLQCRAFSLTERLEKGTDQVWGVWGGLSKYDRRNEDKVRRILDETRAQLEMVEHG